MRLLIISTDATGQVSLASERVFADAGEATRELARLIGEGAVDTAAQFCTVDMDAAVPVIILQQPAPAPVVPLDEPVEEPYAAEVLEQLASVSEDATPEAEGIDIPVVTAAVAGSEPLEALADIDDVPTPDFTAMADEPEAFAEVVADEQPAAAEDVAVSEDAPTPDAPAQWPWDLPVAGDEVAPADDADEVVASVAPDEAPVDDFTFPETLVAMPDPPAMPDVTGVAFRDPQPLSKEALAEGLAALAEAPAVGQPEPTIDAGGEELALAEIQADEPPADDAEGPGFAGMADVVAALAETIPAEAEDASGADDGFAVDDAIIEPETLAELGVAEPLGVISPDPAAAAETAPADLTESPYEPGALKMTDYTCNDCVYVNTCPNQHQKQPAECGSFQWRAV